jgi:glycosyltransferase involved in cell wall biosynthesis
MFVHLHGGTIGRDLFDRYPVWRRINASFIRRLGGVIVSGVSHVEIFSGMIDPRQIHTVPNCAEDDLFVEESAIFDKFARRRPLRVLYLSSMTIDKGYLDLADAWFSLTPDLRALIQLDFAGRFESDADRAEFEGRISGVEGIAYHGLVDRERKRCLFAEAHVFCLPTRMSEGQPISILEAYAAGCVVLTTDKPGIRDVFTDGVNGFQVIERSPASIGAVLTGALENVDRLRQIALGNRRIAGTRHRTATFTAALSRILEAGVGA